MKITRHTPAWALATAGFFVLAGLLLASCDTFLDRPPQGALSQEVLANEQGVQTLLIGAYGALDGQGIVGVPWATAGTNWVYGSVAGGVAHKGSHSGDQPNINPIAGWNVSPINPFLNSFWIARYEGVARTNAVLSLLPQVEDMSEEEKTAVAAEARFLRGHYYFDLKKMFNNIPWIDENTTDFKQPNTGDSLWINIEADFRFAMENLPPTQAQEARANTWAAAAYLAKSYLYQEKWQEAADLFDQVINQGQTSDGQPYALPARFSDVFRASTERHAGVVFSIEFVANAGTATIDNSRQGEMLNFPYGGAFPCCGFYQATQDLVNSYRVDPETGLPLIDSYNADPVRSDLGLLSTEPFTVSDQPVDPRVDWTAGRRGIPFHDWGPHPGRAWIREQPYAGPYATKKNIYRQGAQDQYYNGNEWAPGTAIDYNVIRLADVLLMAAEAHAHTGNLNQARLYVNRVRERVMDPNPADGEVPEGWVSNDQNIAFAAAVVDSEAEMEAADVGVGDWVVRTDRNSTFVLIDTGTWNEYTIPDYQIGLYPPGSFASVEDALDKIYFERKLELSLEGHRFFDLSRWGIAEEVLNDFYHYEGTVFGTTDVSDGSFTAPTNKYFPIPQRQIDLTTVDGEPTLQQNPGY